MLVNRGTWRVPTPVYRYLMGTESFRLAIIHPKRANGSRLYHQRGFGRSQISCEHRNVQHTTRSSNSVRYMTVSAAHKADHRSTKGSSKAASAASSKKDPNSLENIRNIGIIAHIDAGKTTTTERMLYYVGFTEEIGEVHDGSTVTDYLKPERERGITITSACIPMLWNGSRVNLIDTPGHVDFTMEVERSMRVLDGAVLVLDAVAGVEAQTETVWAQANRHSVCRMAYINKLDREGASSVRAMTMMENDLQGWGIPVLINWPVVVDNTRHVLGKGSGGPGFQGVVDLIDMEYLDFHTGDASHGSIVKRVPLDKAIEDESSPLYFKIPKGKALVDHLLPETLTARESMLEKIAELDEEFLEEYMEVDMDPSKVNPESIKSAIRRATVAGKMVPTLCGSSYKNIGVQPLLDSVVAYLPSPKEVLHLPKAAIVDGDNLITPSNNGKPSASEDTKDASVTTGSRTTQVDLYNTLVSSDDVSGIVEIPPKKDAPFRALAFKIIKDKNRGILVFVRIYSGSLQRGERLYNVNKGCEERAMKVLEMYADDYEELSSSACGNVVAISGLKYTGTGDTLLLLKDVTKAVTANNGNQEIETESKVVCLETIKIPPPVFMRAVEPKSQAEAVKIKDALDLLVREDPSLRVAEDEETGQIIVSGMGELHLEISQDRLKETYGVGCKMGKVQISYRESLSKTPPTIKETRVDGIQKPWLFDYELNKEILGVTFKAGVQIELFSLGSVSDDGEFVEVSDDQYLLNKSLDLADEYDQKELIASGVVTTNENRGSGKRDRRKLSQHIFRTRNAEDTLIRYTPTEKERSEISRAVFDSIRIALSRGSLAGFPLVNIGARVTQIVMANPSNDSSDSSGAKTKTTPSSIRTAIQHAITESISKLGGGSRLMEPYMRTDIVVHDKYVGPVTRDITRNRLGDVVNVREGIKLTQDTDNAEQESSADDIGVGSITNRVTIEATIPLSSMIGYSTTLRTLTQGDGTFFMELHGYKAVPLSMTTKILDEIKGYA